MGAFTWCNRKLPSSAHPVALDEEFARKGIRQGGEPRTRGAWKHGGKNRWFGVDTRGFHDIFRNRHL